MKKSRYIFTAGPTMLRAVRKAVRMAALMAALVAALMAAPGVFGGFNALAQTDTWSADEESREQDGNVTLVTHVAETHTNYRNWDFGWSVDFDGARVTPDRGSLDGTSRSGYFDRETFTVRFRTDAVNKDYVLGRVKIYYGPYYTKKDDFETTETDWYHMTQGTDITVQVKVPQGCDLLAFHILMTLRSEKEDNPTSKVQIHWNLAPSPDKAAEEPEYYDTSGIDGIEDIEDIDNRIEVLETSADKEKGENSWTIPAAIAAVLVIGGIALGGRKKGGKGGKENEKITRTLRDPGKSDRRRKDEDQPVSYQMRIHKDFGNTLVPGDPPERVYAKIVRIGADGSETTDTALTNKICIYGDGYLRIGNPSIVGDSISATVEAPKSRKQPEEGIVTFSLTNAGAGFVNRMHFRIGGAQILFGQEDLTIPAGFDQPVRLPFVVDGFFDDVKVTARISDGSYNPDGDKGAYDYGAYRVEVEYNEAERLYYAIITEKKWVARGEPGDYQIFYLIVNAECEGISASNSLPIYRFNMGLRLNLDCIECFPEAESKATLALYDYDLDAHKLLVWSPGMSGKGASGSPDNPVITGYRITAKDNRRQELVERLHIVCDVRDALQMGRSCVFFPKDAFLDPPARLEATVCITASCGERTYTVEKPVLLTSQPVRELTTEARKADERIGEGLLNIRNQIWNQHLVSRLFPLLKMIDAMTDGYDPAYGYDAAQVKAVQDIYMGFLRGEIEGANGSAKMVTLGDEMRMFMSSFVQTVEESQEALSGAKGILARLALGYFTAGASEAVFQGFDLVCNGVEMGKNVVEAVENGQSKGAAVFCVGAKIMAREAFWDYAGKKVGDAVSAEVERLKSAGFNKENLKKAGGEMMENMGFFGGRKAKIALGAIDDSAAAGARASASGKGILNLTGSSSGLSPEDLELQRAFASNQALARENLENMRSAMDLYRMNPTDANLKLRNEYVMKCQQSKSMMYRLQDYSDTSLDSVRKEFNSVMSDFHKGASDLTIVDLSERYGIPPDQIQQFKATSASQAKVAAGKKLPIDSDTTLYWEKPDGTVVYFDQDEVQAIYERHLYKESLGFEASDSSFAKRFSEKMDSTVIEDVAGHAESYGKDVAKMTQTAQHGTALEDPHKVAEAVRYKMKHWFEQGDALRQQANAAATAAERETLLQMAEEKYREGLRQGTKIFDNCTNPRDVARIEVNGTSRIDDKIRTAVEISRAASDPLAPRSSVDIESCLQTIGYTRDSFADACGDLIEKIG